MFHGAQGQSGTQSCGADEERREIVQQKVPIPVPQGMQHATMVETTAEKTPPPLDSSVQYQQMATEVTGVSMYIEILLVHVFDLQEYIISYYTQQSSCKNYPQHLLLTTWTALCVRVLALSLKAIQYD